MKKKALAVAIASGLAVPMAAQAVNWDLSGQVNKAVMFADDGDGSDILIVDNDVSSSRFRLKGVEALTGGMSGLKAGFLVEYEFQSNASNTIGNKPLGDTGQVNFNERHAVGYFEGNWGRLSIGQTDGAGNGTSERDLSGTGATINYSSYSAIGGGILFRTGDGAAPVGAIRNNASNFDGFSRYDLVRYDSPVLGPGFGFAASKGVEDQWELAASIRTSLAGGKLDGALAYGESGPGRLARDQWGGSVSFLFSQGTNITFGYQEADLDNFDRDPDNIWFKLGHKWGNHAVSGTYGESSDVAAEDRDYEEWGLGWTYTMPRPKVQIYAGYKNADLDVEDGVEDVDDIDILTVGTKIRF